VIPPALMFILYKYNKNRGNNTYEWRYSLLTRPFKYQYYWWELVHLLKKTVLVVLVDATNGYSTQSRIFITLMFLIMVFVLESILRPYKAEGLATLASTRYVITFRV
jgi:hypothetical protein